MQTFGRYMRLHSRAIFLSGENSFIYILSSLCTSRHGRERFRKRCHNDDREEIRTEIIGDRLDSGRLWYRQLPSARASKLSRRPCKSIKTEVSRTTTYARVHAYTCVSTAPLSYALILIPTYRALSTTQTPSFLPPISPLPRRPFAHKY